MEALELQGVEERLMGNRAVYSAGSSEYKTKDRE